MNHVMTDQPELNRASTQTVRELATDWLVMRVRTQAGVVPEIASIDWVRLPDSHPLKIAAVCSAALAWVRHTDPAQIRADLLDELEVVAFLKQEAVDEAYSRTIRMLTNGPTRAEVERRRAAATSPIGRPWTAEELGAA